MRFRDRFKLWYDQLVLDGLRDKRLKHQTIAKEALDDYHAVIYHATGHQIMPRRGWPYVALSWVAARLLQLYWRLLNWRLLRR